MKLKLSNSGSRPSCRPRESGDLKGYTLIEILIVLFIISIVTTTALLSLGVNSHRQIENTADEIMQMIGLAQEEALLQPNVIGLAIQPQAIQFFTYQASADKDVNPWVPMEEKSLTNLKLPNDIDVTLGNNTEDNHPPQIVISSNGDLTPFTLYIGKKNDKPYLYIKGLEDGTLIKKLI